jgi:hypothetical protein
VVATQGRVTHGHYRFVERYILWTGVARRIALDYVTAANTSEPEFSQTLFLILDIA